MDGFSLIYGAARSAENQRDLMRTPCPLSPRGRTPSAPPTALYTTKVQNTLYTLVYYTYASRVTSAHIAGLQPGCNLHTVRTANRAGPGVIVRIIK
jgi:hypothetical protein